MAVLPRCYHFTGPAMLPLTPQSCRQWSPGHRPQTAVVTPRDRHVRSENAVVPPHREEEQCVTGSGKLWKTTGGVTTVMAVLTKNRSGTAPPVWRGYKIGLDTVSHLQPTLVTGVDGGESEFLWRGWNSHVVLILQQLNKTLSKTPS